MPDILRPHRLPILVLLLSALFVAACSDADAPNDPDPSIGNSGRGKLVSSRLVERMARAEIANTITSNAIPILTAQYDVALYKLVYETVNAKGEKTQASGVISIPENAGRALPLVSYQHGTVVEKIAVPSVQGFDLETMLLGTSGYITVAPDYLGLGDASGLHPYVHAASLATAIVDMLRAAKAFLAERSIAWNGKLFLMGYSEGGYATMAAHRALEGEYAGEFTVTASAPMAGPYDLSGSMSETMLSDEPYPFPLYLPYTVLAYNEIYGLFGSLDEVFKEPYASMIPTLFDGAHDFWEVNDFFPSVPSEMLRPEFIAAYESDPGHPLRKRLRENDLTNWTPRAPVRMFHCTEDDQVPYRNSVVALARFQERGGTTVELITLEFGNHTQCGRPALLGGKLWFDTMAQ